MTETVREADLLQCGLRALAAVAKPDTGVEETIGDVVEGRDAGRQMEVLEHEADAAGAQRREVAVPERRHIEPVDLDVAGARAIERADDVEHRRFARPGRSDDRDELAAADLEADIAQREDAARERARDVPERHDR